MRKNKKNGLFSDILTTVTRYFLIFVFIAVAGICLSGIRVVKSGEVAIILRFGKIVGDTYEEQIHEPGLLFAFPYIIDEVVTVPKESVMQTTVNTHYTDGYMSTLDNNGYVITGDQNIAVVSASVKYVISDPVAYALRVKDIDTVINAFVSNAMIEEAARISVDTLLTSGKEAYGTDILSRAQAGLSSIGAGVTISTVELTNVSMPSEVKEVYDMVTSANVQYSTALEEAKLYRDGLIPSAQKEANTLIAAAQQDYAQRVAAAKSDLAEFWGLVDEYKLHPDVVKTRVYSTKVAQAISKIGKVRVVQDGETKIFIE